LQAGIRSFIREMDDLGAAMIATPSGVSLGCWLLSALAAVGACEIARRQIRRGQMDPTAGVTNEPMFSWLPDGEPNPDSHQV
jgi:hypothetical protein